MFNLLVIFDNSIKYYSGIAECDILNKIRDQVVVADKYINMHSDNEVSLEYNNELIKIMENINWVIEPEKINYFVQKLGEFIFYIICKEKELSIYRIKEQQNKSTPDFKIEYTQKDIFFEIKTPTYVCSSNHIKNDLEESLNNNIELENQIKNGKRCALVERCISPYYGSHKSNNHCCPR